MDSLGMMPGDYYTDASLKSTISTLTTRKCVSAALSSDLQNHASKRLLDISTWMSHRSIRCTNRVLDFPPSLFLYQTPPFLGRINGIFPLETWEPLIISTCTPPTNLDITTVMCHFTTGTRSEKCVVRQFSHGVNVTDCIIQIKMI